MILKDLIEELEKHPKDTIIKNGFGTPMSWRGSYSELAFEPENNVTIGYMLDNAKSALGKTFTGYKGGEFEMGEYTDCYLAEYGRTGESIGNLLLSYMLNDVVS
jgi:hypothetical protein